MSISDVIKDSFLKQFSNGSINAPSLAIALVLALLFGFLIYYVYTRFYAGVIYSRSYAITLIGMCVLTCMVTLAISSNVVISLGMVGSLSIVRYRTAVKDALDLLYMFWAITVGITIGANMVMIAVIASLIMIVMIVVVSNRPLSGMVYVAVIHYESSMTKDEIIRSLGRKKYSIKSETMYKNKTELALEVFLKKDELHIFDKVKEIDGVLDVTLIQYNGEYHG